jgi:formate dehydrogenase subunit gamma
MIAQSSEDRLGIRLHLRTRLNFEPMGEFVLRFTRTERAAHWVAAGAFFSMLGSGLFIGKRGTFHTVMYAWHLSSAGVLVLGLGLLTLGGDRRALRGSVHDLTRIDARDRAWLASVPGQLRRIVKAPAVARFNAGQKINFIVISALLAVLLISGVDTIIAGTEGNLVFGLHKVATIAACVLVGGHLYMALINPGTRPALRGMLTGDVEREWARLHHADWRTGGE